MQPVARPPIAASSLPAARPPEPQQPAARPPQADEDQPASRLPTSEVAPKARPVPQVEQRVAQPGDRICASCGEPNDPSRRFCRRCGASLTAAKIVADPKLPWWKRLFGGGRKQPRQYAAGERMGSMQKAAPKTGGIRGVLKGIGIVRGLLAVVVAIGIFGYVGIPSFQGMVNSALDPITRGGPTQIIENIRKLVAPKPAQVTPRPEDVTATTELEGHEARRIADLATNTDWQATDNVPVLTVRFEEPVDMLSVIVRPGNGASFAEFRRPATLEFVFPGGSTKRIDLEDTKDPQTFEMTGDNVDVLVIRVVDTNGPDAAPISISEIEFFRKG
jgi:hypothetical protein